MTLTLPNIKIPRILLRDPDRLGGTVEGAFLCGDARFENGLLSAISPASGPCDTLLMPPLVEPHCHLDKCHTVDRLEDIGGDLTAAIEAQRADKINWTDADIRNRALRGIEEYTRAGTGLIRSHVDWGDEAEPPLSWQVLTELAADTPGLQLCSLTSAIQMADPAFAKTASDAIPDGHALGVFVFNQPDHNIGIEQAFQQAQRLNLPLDFHVDEGLAPDLRGLEKIADTAIATRHDGPILCGHAVSLASQPADDVRRIADKLARANITVAALPTTNLYLQGRTNGTPRQRGLTMLHELRRAGVRIVIGADNVRDAFCPVGRHDPLRTLELAVLAGHLDPPFDQWLPAITTDAAHALGQAPMYVDNTPISRLLHAKAGDLSTLISGAPLAPIPQE
ncbi:amidohydrolase family protein [Shimia sp. CNT1-13L.2]|uniref:amidohydrolase family protein n=1 Tax=Shimia sp. CNT1-13L.2 TaxID=2959663 RepID=UPI0020CEF68B|nr:amidohydrolase family protein [Shimia sp. CNT1-13L.2]MCP9480980.1 amidohydrolase family protein [Shimia sp. CNT1-13L.2]